MTDCINAASEEVFGVSTPREFQYVGAYHTMINDDTVLAVPQKTASGKTLIVRLASFYRRGISLNLVPLLGLATEQVDRAILAEHNMEGYHCDEHKLEDCKLLMDRLRQYNSDGEEAKHVTINLFIGPKALTSVSWKTLLERLARKGLLSMIVIDEAHYVNQSGRNFRPEFESAVRFLGCLLTIMTMCVPLVLMSATILRDDVARCTDLLGKKHLCVLHGSL